MVTTGNGACRSSFSDSRFDDPLITECTVQGVLMHISTDEKIREAAEKSFLYQLDNLRKRATWPSDFDGGDPNDP